MKTLLHLNLSVLIVLLLGMHTAFGQVDAGNSSATTTEFHHNGTVLFEIDVQDDAGVGITGLTENQVGIVSGTDFLNLIQLNDISAWEVTDFTEVGGGIYSWVVTRVTTLPVSRTWGVFADGVEFDSVTIEFRDDGPPPSTAITVCDTGCDHTTIQDAIDAATGGETIEVLAGTYDGFRVPGLVDLTIITTEDAVITPVNISGETTGAYIDPGTTGLVIDGFIFDGDGIPGSTRGVLGRPDTEYTVQNSEFDYLTTGVYSNAGASGNVELTVVNNTFRWNTSAIGGTENTNPAIITGNTFENNRNGIGIANNTDGINISGNSFVIDDLDALEAAFGSSRYVSNRGNLEGTPAENVITDNTFSPAARFALSGNNTTHIVPVGSNAISPVQVIQGGIAVSGHPTIQAAVTAADPGDTIEVSSGTYNENITIDKSLSLVSVDGRDVTIIEGDATGIQLGTVRIQGTVSDMTIDGFTIIGIDDNTAPGIEKAAVYISGSLSNSSIINNEIEARGAAGLLAEFGATIDEVTIDSNIFSGQTFLGPNPAGNGFADQFTLANVPRQLVAMGNGGGTTGALATNVNFTNNMITGVAGGLNTGGDEQGNTLVTLDVQDAVITGNTFDGATTRFASSLRARRALDTFSGNTFNSDNLGMATGHIFVQNNDASFMDFVDNNTFDKGSIIVGNTNSIPVASAEDVAGNAGVAAADVNDLSDIYVGDGGSIQVAIDFVQMNDSITVLAGDYDEDLDVNKQVQLVADGAPRLDRMTISASGGTVTGGFHFGHFPMPAGPHILITDGADNINIVNNTFEDISVSGIVVDDTGTNSGISITGNVINGIVGTTPADMITAINLMTTAFSNVLENSIDGMFDTGTPTELSSRGIRVSGAETVRVEDNSVMNLGAFGFEFITADGPVDGINATGNSATNLTLQGVPNQGVFRLSQAAHPMDNVVISDNNMFETLTGLWTNNGVFGPGSEFTGNSMTDVTFGIRHDMNPSAPAFDARNNFWGDISGPSGGAIDADSGAEANGTGAEIFLINAMSPIVFDPWVGQGETQDVEDNDPIVFGNGVTLEFTHLPSDLDPDASVTVSVTESMPSSFPVYAGAGDVLELFVDITATNLENYTFTVNVTIDVSDVAGFGPDTVVFYFSQSAGEYLPIANGVYDPMAETFSFTTNHFTPFIFVNPTDPVHVSVVLEGEDADGETVYRPSAGAGAIPTALAADYNTGDGMTFKVDDWSYDTHLVTFHVIPKASAFGVVSANLTVEFDTDKAEFIGVTEGDFWMSYGLTAANAPVTTGTRTSVEINTGSTSGNSTPDGD